MRLPPIALAVAVLLCPRADATAFAGVELAFWQVDFAYYVDPASDAPLSVLPAGVNLECTGSAESIGTGCGDRKGISVTSSGPLERGLVNALGGFTLHNTGSTDYLGNFVFFTSFSAFNPGGPEIGARVDDPAHEFASFFSVVSGPGVFDLHGCNMTNGKGPYAKSAGASCGVSSPDSSEGMAVFGPLLAGEGLSAAYDITVQVLAKGDDPVPEPWSLAVLLPGLFLLRRFRAV